MRLYTPKPPKKRKPVEPHKYNMVTEAWIQGVIVATCLTRIKSSKRIKHYIHRFLAIKSLSDNELSMWRRLNKKNNVNGCISATDLYNICFMTVITTKQIDVLTGPDVETNIDDEVLKYIKIHENLDKVQMLRKVANQMVKYEDIDYEELNSVMHKRTSTYKEDTTLEDLEIIYNENNDTTTISTCIDEIDKARAMFRKGTVNAVMGYTGSYKTMYCVNLAYKAIQNGLNICFVSLEISKKEMYYNFLSRYSNESQFEHRISHSDMKFKELNEEDEKYLFRKIVPEFANNFSQHLVIVDECDFNSDTSYNFDSMFKIVDSTFIENTGRGVDLVIIDHLNLLKFNSSNEQNDYAKINHWMAYFRKNCKNFATKHKEVCIVVAVQSSRAGYDTAKYQGGQFELTGAAEGNEIERASEVFLALYADADLKANKQAKIQLLKGRNCGEMPAPVLINVDPKYYYLGSYKKEQEADDEKDDIVNFCELENNSFSVTTQ